VFSSELNIARAGQSVPITSALTDADGNEVTSTSAVVGAEFDGAAPTAADAVQHDGGQYVVLARTSRSWSWTTRTLTLRLDDGTTHTARFEFR